MMLIYTQKGLREWVYLQMNISNNNNNNDKYISYFEVKLP